MARFLHLATTPRNSAVDAIAGDIDAGASAGTITVYTTGSGIPATALTAITDQTALAVFTLNDPAFANAVGGSAVINNVADTTALADGEATWARVRDSNGNVVFDGDVSETDGTFVINEASIVAGATVSLESGSLTMPSGE